MRFSFASAFVKSLQSIAKVLWESQVLHPQPHLDVGSAFTTQLLSNKECFTASPQSHLACRGRTDGAYLRYVLFTTVVWSPVDFRRRVLRVKRTFGSTILAVIATGTLLAFPQPTSGGGQFKWNWHNWRELSWKQSINRSKTVPVSIRGKLIDAVVAAMRPFVTDLNISSDVELRRVAGDTRITFVDLGNGARSVVAQAGGEKSGCSPTGNCPFWILMPIKAGYSVVLAGEAQTFTIQPTRTHALKDIVLGRHGSAFDSELTVYRFNGKKYEAGPCYDATWSALGKDGEYHTLREPRMMPCGQE